MHLSLHQQLRLARKKSSLSVDDLEHLLGMPQSRNLTRYERGKRNWSIEMLVVYHLIYELKFDHIFQPLITNMKTEVSLRISQLLVNLQFEAQTPKRKIRKDFLESALQKLTQSIYHEK